MQNLGAVKKHCNGMMRLEVYQALYDAGREAGPGICLEIGTGHGASAISTALGMKDSGGGRVITVDRLERGSRAKYGSIADNEKIIKDNISEFDVGDTVELVIGDADKIDVKSLKIDKIQMLFIDADGQVDRDMGTFYDLVVPGGIIVFDDCVPTGRAFFRNTKAISLDMKSKITHHLAEYFVEAGFLEKVKHLDNTAFFRKPKSMTKPAKFDSDAIIRAYRKLIFAQFKCSPIRLLISSMSRTPLGSFLKRYIRTT